jgi:hypothetical protein
MLLCSVLYILPGGNDLAVVQNVKADFIGFNSDVRVNDDTTNKEQSSVAMVTYNDEIYMVWHDMRNGDFDIYFTKSTDGGTTWGDGSDNNNDVRVDDTDSNTNLSDDSSTQKYPDIAVDNSGNIYVVWQDNRGNRGDHDIYLAKSTDSGATFNANVRVDDNGTGIFDQLHPCIGADNLGNIYIAWEDERESKTDFDIYFTKSIDGGATFVTPNVHADDDTGTGLQKKPKIAVNNSASPPVLYIVWQDDRIIQNNFDVFFTYSTDGGTIWNDGIANDNDKRINDYTTSGQVRVLKIYI